MLDSSCCYLLSSFSILTLLWKMLNKLSFNRSWNLLNMMFLLLGLLYKLNLVKLNSLLYLMIFNCLCLDFYRHWNCVLCFLQIIFSFISLRLVERVLLLYFTIKLSLLKLFNLTDWCFRRLWLNYKLVKYKFMILFQSSRFLVNWIRALMSHFFIWNTFRRNSLLSLGWEPRLRRR